MLNEGPLVFKDERGDVTVLYETATTVLKRSRSFAGVFRGMHWQTPESPQNKIIRVVSGRILDFVFDPQDEQAPIYCSSIEPGHGWVRIGAHLAHGFYAETETVFEYICDGQYSAAHELAFSISKVLESELGLSDLNISAKDRVGHPVVRNLVRAQMSL